MVLEFQHDVSPADWFARSDEPWQRLCTLGPAGFAAYARVFHPAVPDEDTIDHEALAALGGTIEDVILGRLLRVLAAHTSTRDDCFFGLWEGFGDIHGSPAVTVVGRDAPGRPRMVVPPAFPPEVLDGPRVRSPARDYLLFRGLLGQAGDWGAADLWPGQPREVSIPNLMWPADHAWFFAFDVDDVWAGVGGSREPIDAVAAIPALRVERVELVADPPYYRALGG